MLKLFNPGYTQLTFFILFPKNCLFFSLPLFTHSTVQQKRWTQKEQLCNCLLFKKNYWCLMQNTFVWLYAMHFWGFACASATFYTLFVDEKAETGGSKFDILKWREKCQNVSNTFYEAVGTLSTNESIWVFHLCTNTTGDEDLAKQPSVQSTGSLPQSTNAWPNICVTLFIL